MSTKKKQDLDLANIVELLGEFLGMATALWEKGNVFLRWAMVIVVVWPWAMIDVALLNNPTVTSIAGLVPLVGIVFMFLAAIDPLALCVVGIADKGRRALGWITLVLAVEFAIALYLVFVPIRNDPGMVPMVVLTAVTALFFYWADYRGLAKLITFLAIGLTLVLFLGGRDGVKQAMAKVESAIHEVASAPSNVSAPRPPTMEDIIASWPICADEEDKELLVKRNATAVRLSIPNGCWSREICFRDNPTRAHIVPMAGQAFGVYFEHRRPVWIPQYGSLEIPARNPMPQCRRVAGGGVFELSSYTPE